MQCGLSAATFRPHISGVNCVWCNGEFVEGPLAVSASDRGLTHGLGIFETLLARDGRPVVLEMHLERMRNGAERLGWRTEGLHSTLIEEAIRGLLEKRDLKHGRARVRIALSAGEGSLQELARGENSLLWIVASRAPEAPEAVAMITASFPRNEASPLAGIKCASYAENLVALDHARRNGAEEALFYNTKGELCEGTTSNLFLVKNGEVFTPPLSSGCLPGTTRARVIAKCRELGITVVEAPLSVRDLEQASEVFSTSATRGVVPVRRIDRRDYETSGRISAKLRSEVQ